jgi:hypothetical protein
MTSRQQIEFPRSRSDARLAGQALRRSCRFARSDGQKEHGAVQAWEHCGASALVWHLLQFLRRVLSCGTPARRGMRLNACSSTPHVHRAKC